MSTNNILIIDSGAGAPGLTNLFAELAAADRSLYFFSGRPELLRTEAGVNWPVKKIFLRPRNIDGRTGLALFLLLWPLYFIIFFFGLLRYTNKRRVGTVVCFSWPEKVAAALPSAILGIRTLWVELPGETQGQKNRLTRAIYRFFSRWARLIVLNGQTRERLLRENIPAGRIFPIPPGIKPDHYGLQDNIFNQLAGHKQNQHNRKFFTVGTAANLDRGGQLETLFGAAKKCLTVIPNLQIIVIGDGRERKSSHWLAKRLEIDELVWFVGDQKHLKKWLDNFDIFACVSEPLKIADINAVLRAAAAGLPIIGTEAAGLENIVSKQTGFLSAPGNCEALAQNIIKLYKDKNLRQHMGQAARVAVAKNFTIDKMAERFRAAIDNGDTTRCSSCRL